MIVWVSCDFDSMNPSHPSHPSPRAVGLRARAQRRDEEFEPPPLAACLDRVASEVAVERLIVRQQQVDLRLAIRRERLLVGGKARPPHVLEGAARLDA